MESGLGVYIYGRFWLLGIGYVLGELPKLSSTKGWNVSQVVEQHSFYWHNFNRKQFLAPREEFSIKISNS